MRYKITGVLLLSMAGVFSGCSTAQIDNALASAAGNKAPYRFYFTAPEKVERWYFSDANYKALPPRTYVKDWSKMAGWRGVEDAQGSMLALYMKEEPGLLNYAVKISSSSGTLGPVSQAVKEKNIIFLRKLFPTKEYNNGEVGSINLHFEMKGTGPYPCLVSDSVEKKRGVYTKTYICYRFAENKALYKNVTINFIYIKSPKLPKKYRHLAREYTFSDLKRRAKRTLDSLYIKDWWN